MCQYDDCQKLLPRSFGMTILEGIPFFGTSRHLPLVCFHAFCHHLINGPTFLALWRFFVIGGQWNLFGLGIAVGTIHFLFGWFFGLFKKPAPHIMEDVGSFGRDERLDAVGCWIERFIGYWVLVVGLLKSSLLVWWRHRYLDWLTIEKQTHRMSQAFLPVMLGKKTISKTFIAKYGIP